MIAEIAPEELHAILGVPRMTADVLLVEALATPERDARILYQIAKTLLPKVILEIGTFYGHTTYGLALNSPDSKLYTLDIYKEMGIAVPAYQERELLPRQEVGKHFRGKISISSRCSEIRDAWRPTGSCRSLTLCLSMVTTTSMPSSPTRQM